jgi:magnesium transporter
MDRILPPKLYENLKRLLRRRAYNHTRNLLAKTHPADIATLFRLFDEHSQKKIFELVEDHERQAEVLSYLDRDLVPDVLVGVDEGEIIDIMTEVPPDDLADILASLPDDLREKILKGIEDKNQEEVEDLMTYGEQSAGGIMSPDFLALDENTTAEEAIHKLRQLHEDVEMAFYIYVVNEREELVGVLSLRELVTCGPDTELKELMETNVVQVHTEDDQEYVAMLVSRYDLLAIPVTDHSQRLVGIITVDDVIDVLREEATEDMLMMAGAGDHMMDVMSVGRNFRRRLPWLFITWVGQAVAALIIGIYEPTMRAVVPLAAFLPMIVGMAGNVGTQSTTIVVRALATGRTDFSQMWRTIGREMIVGGLMGFLYGALLGAFGFLRFMDSPVVDSLLLGGVIAVSLLSSMLVAVLISTLLPFLLTRMRLDPAVATAPFVTTITDVIGILLYLAIATAILL